MGQGDRPTSVADWLSPVWSKVSRRVNEKLLHRIQTFHFDIVQGCQLRCVGCPNSTLLPKIDHISADGFAKCLRNVDVRTVETLRLFNFGEPFLHPSLPELLPVLRSSPFSVSRVEISTNAMIANEDYLRAIFTSGVVTHLYVSCDGNGTPEEFERLRPPAKWPKLLQFLEVAQSLRDRLSSRVQLCTRTICTDSEEQARWMNVLGPRGWTPEFRPWLMLPLASINPLGREAKVENRVCWPMEGVNLFVDCHGDVIPCCSFPGLPAMGNLYNQKFSEIHRGEARKSMLCMLKHRRVEDAICGHCDS